MIDFACIRPFDGSVELGFGWALSGRGLGWIWLGWTRFWLAACLVPWLGVDLAGLDSVWVGCLVHVCTRAPGAHACTLHPAPCTLHFAPGKRICTTYPIVCTPHQALPSVPCTLHPAPCTGRSRVHRGQLAPQRPFLTSLLACFLACLPTYLLTACFSGMAPPHRSFLAVSRRSTPRCR